MKFALLDLKEADELKIDGRQAKHYDIDYDIANNELHYRVNDKKSKKISSYILDKPLVNAVNAAIVTGRPLLLKGEPGCGKTKLAQAIANYFFKQDAYKYYFEWHVKSKSKAREGAYVFDHVGRMRDASVASTDPDAKERASDPNHYIDLGALGKAIKTGMLDKGRKPILLIDEIDKGDIDFPNDLLLELDEMRFRINEKKDFYIETDEKNFRPLVFITSNNERELPPAFLRRCLYYYIPAFEQDLLIKIAKSKMSDFYEELSLGNPPNFDIPEATDANEESDDKKDNPIKNFVKAYLTARDNSSGSKPPSTSEMLDWLKLLTYHSVREGKKLEDLVKVPDLRQMALKLNA